MKRDSLPATALFSGSADYLAALEAEKPEWLPAPAPVRFEKKEAVSVSDLPLLKCEATQVGVLQLINAYRFHGFRAANLDPLNRLPTPHIPELDPGNHGLTPADLDAEYETGSLAGPARDTLRNIIARVTKAYCGTLSAEYMHLTDTQQKRWLQKRLESEDLAPRFDDELRRWLLTQLTAAETLEKTLHTRFVGQKRFSLEGGESLIPLLNDLIDQAARAGIQEIGLGMAHRGRLNVLHNVLGRSVIELFEHAHHDEVEAHKTGDVKYHQGFAADLNPPGGPIRVALAFNPSHLEIVNPVVEGWVRAQQQRRGDRDGSQVMPILIHGDAAFAGQGVVMETLNMAATRGFKTGGTIHIVINNQIGFTTSDPRDSRSSLYCTDVMKMVEGPVLHVNGDDPEAVIRATRIAIEYRMFWKRDIAIDLICYRRLGHNEQDEPMATQPLMYRRIHALPGTRALYAEKLVGRGTVEEGGPDALIQDCKKCLDTPACRQAGGGKSEFAADWSLYKYTHWRVATRTAIPMNRLQALAKRLVDVPASFTLHPRVKKIIDDRRQMGEGALPLDWGMAESLAYASLLTDGTPVRLSGQDSGRGTFFHRHAVLHDQNREKWDSGAYIPLQHLIPGQANFLVIDSLLSEEAVLAFEYGYAGSAPDQLVIWEAQFGDFVNGAQVVIDQFIASGETKWDRLNGLTLFLPHGYEGQGPEHSSGRIERFLQLTAHDNIQIAQPSTPAQIFHLLRRQVVRPYRRPLIVFTPKSLLRHADATSALQELAQGAFQPILDDPDAPDPAHVSRIVFCSGRVYYDLAKARRDKQLSHIALIRVEQLYPVADLELQALLARYTKAAEIVWAQDEPRNQGPWRFMAHHLARFCKNPLIYAGRPESSAPATGIASLHKKQLEEILAIALD